MFRLWDLGAGRGVKMAGLRFRGSRSGFSTV